MAKRDPRPNDRTVREELQFRHNQKLGVEEEPKEKKREIDFKFDGSAILDSWLEELRSEKAEGFQRRLAEVRRYLTTPTITTTEDFTVTTGRVEYDRIQMQNTDWEWTTDIIMRRENEDDRIKDEGVDYNDPINREFLIED